MQFRVTNIAGGVDTATLTLQEVRADNPGGTATPNPLPVSSVQLVLPLSDAQNYVIGTQYDLELTPVAK